MDKWVFALQNGWYWQRLDAATNHVLEQSPEHFKELLPCVENAHARGCTVPYEQVEIEVLENRRIRPGALRPPRDTRY